MFESRHRDAGWLQLIRNVTASKTPDCELNLLSHNCDVLDALSEMFGTFFHVSALRRVELKSAGGTLSKEDLKGFYFFCFPLITRQISFVSPKSLQKYIYIYIYHLYQVINSYIVCVAMSNEQEHIGLRLK